MYCSIVTVVNAAANFQTKWQVKWKVKLAELPRQDVPFGMVAHNSRR